MLRVPSATFGQGKAERRFNYWPRESTVLLKDIGEQDYNGNLYQNVAQQ